MLPTVGDIFTVPLRKGRFGAALVVDVETGWVRFLVLDGFWDAPPASATLAALELAPLPFGQPAVLHDDVWKGSFEGWSDDFDIVAHRDLNEEEVDLGRAVSGTMIFQNPAHFARELHKQWRWLHEREALQAEWQRAHDSRQEQAQRRRETLSLTTMARERPFHHWGNLWSSSVVKEARRIFRDATRALIALEGTKKRKERVAALRGIVDAFNALDDQTGCIESTERDEIVERIEELASLVGLTNKHEALTGHRRW